jgi:predicted transcriptional regulator
MIDCQENTENKLLLLYIIEKLNVKISNLQITKIALENKLMNYFFLQQYLNELCENKLLNITTENTKNYYIITEAGKQALNFFSNRIDEEKKNHINSLIRKIQKNIKNETKILADFTPVSENEYIVDCKIQEDTFSLLELKVLVGTKTDARSICDNWKSNTQDIYVEILNALNKNKLPE